MMKNIIIAIGTVALLLTSCQNENSIDGNDNLPVDAVRFSSQSGTPSSLTRTAYTNVDGSTLSVTWVKSDAVGIYALADRSLGDNYQYAVTPMEDATKCTFFPKVSTQVLRWAHPSEHKFFAYYPFTGAAGDGNPQKTEVKLPAVQNQIVAEPAKHLSALSFMKANPVTVPATTKDGGQGGVSLNFHNVFAVVEFKMVLEELASIDVPIKSVELISTSADLTMPKGTIDITTKIEDGYTAIPCDIEQGSKTAKVIFDKNLSLNKTTTKSVYMVVAPGIHEAGSLKLEITALDDSKLTIDINDAMTFKSNGHHTKSLTLDVDDFAPVDEFDSQFTTTTCGVGELLTFDLSGKANTVEFFSGIEGNEFAYRDKDRIKPAVMNVSFKTTTASGTTGYANPTHADVVYSTDFSGNYTKEGVEAATWINISDKFTLTDDTPITGLPSGVLNIQPLFESSSKPLYFGFYYKVNQYVAPSGSVLENGRTQVTVLEFFIKNEKAPATTLYDVFTSEWQYVLMNGFQASDAPTYLPTLPSGSLGGSTARLLFRSDFRPAVDKDCYAITKALPMELDNFGKDKSLVVKTLEAADVTSYSYTFEKAGTYTMVFVATKSTLMGEKEIIKTYDITVTE